MAIIKTVGILLIISFITGAVVSNYVIDKAKGFIGGTTKSQQDKIPEIKVTTPIEELPRDFVLPDIDMGKADKVIIVFPSIKYGEIRVEVPITKKC